MRRGCGAPGAGTYKGRERNGACTTGLREGNAPSPAAGLENGTRSSSPCVTRATATRGCFGPQHKAPGTTREEKTGRGRWVVCTRDSSAGKAGQPPRHGARIPREEARNWLLHHSVPQFPLRQSQETWQETESAAIPAPAELRCPPAGSHRARAKNQARSRSREESPRQTQNSPSTGKMFPHPQTGKRALNLPQHS